MPKSQRQILILRRIEYLGPSIGREWKFKFGFGRQRRNFSLRLLPKECLKLDAVLARLRGPQVNEISHLSDALHDGYPGWSPELVVEMREMDTKRAYDDYARHVQPMPPEGELSFVVVVPTRGGDDDPASELRFTVALLDYDDWVQPTHPPIEDGDIYWTVETF